ncbi:MAG TPA: manganese efflux pump MntP family protein [bacterium]|nr:manganese efflux pump MntP family protein [bacterium]HPT29450.1 manganese efflux pump MntP family protein [bacterium]
MSFLNILFIAVGLAMDCFAVSLSAGAAMGKLRLAIKISIFFGVFQAGMFFLGWLAGFGFRHFIQGVDHWIALILLAFVGGKMLYEAIKDKQEKKINFASNKMIVLLAIATSIDALAVGISFAFLKTDLILPTIIIGLMSFGLAFLGNFIGKKASDIMGRKAEIVGGIILILIGIKIFLEHVL